MWTVHDADVAGHLWPDARTIERVVRSYDWPGGGRVDGRPAGARRCGQRVSTARRGRRGQRGRRATAGCGSRGRRWRHAGDRPDHGCSPRARLRAAWCARILVSKCGVAVPLTNKGGDALALLGGRAGEDPVGPRNGVPGGRGAEAEPPLRDAAQDDGGLQPADPRADGALQPHAGRHGLATTSGRTRRTGPQCCRR